MHQKMPLFGKKDSQKRKDGRESEKTSSVSYTPSVEDKYELKELLGT